MGISNPSPVGSMLLFSIRLRIFFIVISLARPIFRSNYDDLISQLLDLKDSKEVIYGALDSWVAWEENFPIVSLRRALIALEKEEQWHRVIQVGKCSSSLAHILAHGNIYIWFQKKIFLLCRVNRAFCFEYYDN